MKLNATAKAASETSKNGEVVWVGGSFHRRFAILLIGCPVKNSNLLPSKKEAQETFIDGMN